jgi:hypothetical protein
MCLSLELILVTPPPPTHQLRQAKPLLFVPLNIWWPMPLFLYIDFIYRYSVEVDKEQIYITCNISLGVCLWFCRLDVGLQLGYIGVVLMRLF